MPTNATSSRESGFTLLELSIALAIVAILTIISLPMFMGVRGQAEETAAQTELRDALVPLQAHILDGDRELSLEDGVHEFSGTIRFDGGAVAGIKLQQASDGAICMWRIADTGLVYGLWTSPSGGATLYTELSSLPEDCPQISNASEAGFSSSW